MKKFRFRLERVLRYRELIKREKERELLEANLELDQQVQRLKMLEEARLSNRTQGETLLSAGDVEIVAQYGERLRYEIADQFLTIARAEEAVEKAVEQYIEAVKDAKSLVTLKEKKHQEYVEYVLKEEGKFLDELTVQKGNTMIKDE